MFVFMMTTIVQNLFDNSLKQIPCLKYCPLQSSHMRKNSEGIDFLGIESHIVEQVEDQAPGHEQALLKVS